MISAINERATFNLVTKSYNYSEVTNFNLPHSYNASGTWFIFWQYLGLIILFWAIRDFINIRKAKMTENPRVIKIIFLLCINGGCVALISILQNIYYNNFEGKLHFLIEPSLNKENINQFGPFAYRSNASSYLNLILPIGVGMLIILGKHNIEFRKKRIGNGPDLILIPCVILIACGPIISSSRGGTFIMSGLVILLAYSLIIVKIQSRFLRYTIYLSLLSGILTAKFYGWEKLKPRIMNIYTDNLSGRKEIYDLTLDMIDDYGIYGSGPGSFEAIYQFELERDFTWNSWVHNDYLEFYLTFGIVGMSIISIILFIIFLLAGLNLITGHSRVLICYILMSILGVAVHAIFDFPLQVHSILIIITILLALISIRDNYQSTL